MDYRERVAIVTGASSGIGRQIALDFAGRGAALVLAARRAELFDVTPDDVDDTMRSISWRPPRIVAALKPMLAQGAGYVVNISSGAGRIPPPRAAVYAASKFALTEGVRGRFFEMKWSVA